MKARNEGLVQNHKAGLEWLPVSNLKDSMVLNNLGRVTTASLLVCYAFGYHDEGPNGGAALTNEFGRPNLLGYFRTYAKNPGASFKKMRGYHKPLCWRVVLGNIRREHVEKKKLK